MEYISLILTSALLVQGELSDSDGDFYQLSKNIDYDYPSDVSYRDNKPFMPDPMLSGLDLHVSEDQRRMETDIERNVGDNAFDKKNPRKLRRRPKVKRKNIFSTTEDFQDIEAEVPNVVSYKRNQKYFDGKHQSRDRREKVSGIQRKMKKKSIATKSTIYDFDYEEKSVTEKLHDLNYDLEEETNTERKKLPRGVKRTTPNTFDDSKHTDISRSGAAVVNTGKTSTGDADLAKDLSGRREAHKRFLNALKKNPLDKFFTTSISEDFEKVYKFPVTRRLATRDDDDLLKTIAIIEPPDDDSDSKLMKYFTSEKLDDLTDTPHEKHQTDSADVFDSQVIKKYFSPNLKVSHIRKHSSSPTTPSIVILTGPDDFFNFENSKSPTYKSPIIYYTRTPKPILRSNKTSSNYSTIKFDHKTSKPLIMYKLSKEAKPTVMVLDSGYKEASHNRDYLEDKETRIAKRIMRERLLKNTRKFEDLLTGGDEEICDYIDLSEFTSSSPHISSNFLLIIFVLFALFNYY